MIWKAHIERGDLIETKRAPDSAFGWPRCLKLSSHLVPSARCSTVSVGSTPLASDGAGGRSNRSVSSAKPLIAILSSCAARTTKCDMSRLEQQAKDHARLAHLARPTASRVATVVQPPNGELELRNKELQEQLKVAQSAIAARIAHPPRNAPYYIRAHAGN